MAGLIARKVGSTLCFDGSGVARHITLLSVDDCVVVDHKTIDRDGYTALVVAASVVRSKVVNKPQRGIFSKCDTKPRRIIREFRVSSFSESSAIGAVLGVDMFSAGQLVNVVGRSKGKGFAGAMKRHGFAGLEATHGVSITHRSHGSIGQRTYPSKVFKGKLMAGRMGNDRVTLKNLLVIHIDIDKSVIGVRGAVPGALNGYVMVSNTGA